MAPSDQEATPAGSDLRSAMLDAAERYLVQSHDNDVAIRAVCEAVGVTQPVLYRLFGDKQGLLDALAERGLDRYAEHKGALERTADPVADLRAGWDDHMRFARDNPALYQLMFGTRASAGYRAVRGVFDLLLQLLTRCAATGALRVAPVVATRAFLSANVGAALNRIASPELFDDDDVLSHRLRDALFCRFLLEEYDPPAEHPVAEAAVRLHAQLQTAHDVHALDPAETALLERWLTRLAAGDQEATT